MRHGRFGALLGCWDFGRFRFVFRDVGALFRRLAEQAGGPFFFFGLDGLAAGAKGVFFLPALGTRLATLRAHGQRVLNLAALQLGQFFVQVQVVEVQLFGGPLLLADGARCLRGQRDHRLFRLRRMGALLQQLASRVEHLQARAAAHNATGHAQLSVVDAKACLAMRALGDETVGHAAIRFRQALILAPTPADAYPAIAVSDRIQLEILGIGGSDIFALLGKDARQRQTPTRLN